MCLHIVINRLFCPFVELGESAINDSTISRGTLSPWPENTVCVYLVTKFVLCSQGMVEFLSVGVWADVLPLGVIGIHCTHQCMEAVLFCLSSNMIRLFELGLL